MTPGDQSFRMDLLRRPMRLLWCAGFAVLIGAPPLAAQRTTDHATLKSGIVISGEIKSVKRGQLSFDNPELDVVSIDMDDVSQLVSAHFFEVTLINGRIYRGSLVPGAPRTIAVAIGGDTATAAMDSVARILGFDNTFWGRTNGSLDVGFNIAQTNTFRSLLLGARFEYRGPKWGFNVAPNAYWQVQHVPDTLGDITRQESDRLTVASGISRFLGARWSVQGTGNYESNDELNLDSRVQAGLQGDYELAETQALELRGGLGLASNTEQYTGQDPTTNIEALMTGTIDIFDKGDLDFYFSATLYRPLNTGNRLRADIDGRVTWEVVSDFFIGLTATERVDTRPPLAGSPKRDYQYGFTIGWSWQ